MPSHKDKILFELRIGSLLLQLRKRYATKRSYMRAYNRRQKDKINEYKRWRYKNNINGAKDKPIANSKKWAKNNPEKTKEIQKRARLKRINQL